MKRYIVAILIVMLSAGAASAQDELRLSLKEAIKLVVEKNLDVQVALYTPAQSEADIHKYQGIYNPLLTLLANYQDSATPQSTITGTTTTTEVESIVKQRSTNVNAGLSQLIPTGGTVGVTFNNSWNHYNFGGGGINYFQTNAALNYTQPLLKNFGKETTELAINVARFSKEGALEQFKTNLVTIIAQLKTQYHQLYSLRENLEVKKTSLKLAETILTNTQAQVKAGVLPSMEILNAQFGVATRQKELIDAERALRDQVDVLRVMLQVRDVTDIIPIDSPFRDSYPVDDAAAIRNALAERNDLKQLRVALKTSELQSRVARTQTLPQLDFTTNAGLFGLGSTYSNDLDRVGSGKYPTWNAGLQFTYPLGNDAAKNDYIKSKLLAEQGRTQIRSLEETISRDVRTAIRAVSSGYKQLDVTARGRAYAEEVVQAYIKKQKVGLATTKDVLDVLNNMVTAQGSEIQAVTDYNNAIVTLWKTTGELLPREGIVLGEKEADSLYSANR
jgi:outer membrane protein TolC